MSTLRHLPILVYKELLMEWRQKSVLNALVLYVLSTVFVLYIALFKVEPLVWNGLFWITILFAAVNASAKSFVQEGKNRRLYYYTLANPITIISAKIIYNTILLWGFSLLAYAAFFLFLGNPVVETGTFFIALFMGPLGFSLILTFLSAISTDKQNSSTLLAILGFPTMLPVLLLLIKITAQALELIHNPSVGKDVLLLFAVDLILLALIFVLFPYLWKD